MKTKKEAMTLIALITIVLFGITLAVTACQPRITVPGIAEAREHLAAQIGIAIKPASLIMAIDLGDMTKANSGWRQLLSVIAEAGKYVNLDLSACDMDGTEFNPNHGGAGIPGMDKIVSLVLPDAARSIPEVRPNFSERFDDDSPFNPVFSYFSSLTAVSGAGIETVGSWAFSQCGKLKSVDFPAAAIIGSSAFQYCTALKTVNLLKSESIGHGAFEYCGALETIDLPAAKAIETDTFCGCGALRTASFSAVERLDTRAFFHCTSLKNISLPSVKTIISRAFYGCYALETIELPVVQTIEEEAFGNCKGLKSVSLPASAALIDDNHFRSSPFSEPVRDGNPFPNCTSLAAFILTGSGPLSVIEGGKAIVKDNTTLIAYPTARGNITMNNITGIARSAFLGCRGLINVSFPNVEWVGSKAFEYCEMLKTANLPVVKDLGGGAFGRCIVLESITLGAEAPTYYAPLNDAARYLPERTITVKVPQGAAGYNLSFKNRFADSSGGIILAVVEDERIITAAPPAVVAGAPFAAAPSFVMKQAAPGTPRITSITRIAESLAAQSGTVDEPAYLFLSINLGEMRLAGSGWQQLLETIDKAGKYVVLDLSACTMSGTEFDPVRTLINGKNKIIGIILPDSANSIAEGYHEQRNVGAVTFLAFEKRLLGIASFDHFTALKAVRGDGVTRIGNLAFLWCITLESAGFPAAQRVGSAAFFRCTALKTIDLPAAAVIDEMAFYRCTSLKSANLTLPAAVSIGEIAFYDCAALSTVSFSAAANVSISRDAFYGCTSLVFTVNGNGQLSVREGGKALVKDNSTLIAYPSAWGNLVMNGITHIGDFVFRGNTALINVRFPDTVSVGKAAFSSCDALENASFPFAKSVGNSAFGGCFALETIDIRSAEIIGEYAFSNCHVLQTIDLPNVQTLKHGAFFACRMLKTAILPNAVSIGESAFGACAALKTIDLPKAVSIGDNAFWGGCYALESISLPSAKTIGKGAFIGCTSLKTIYLPMAESIGDNAFWEGPLERISFPASAALEGNPFLGCTSLTFTVIGNGTLSVIERGKALVRNNTDLIAYPSASGGIVMNTITNIGNSAFAGCTLESASFPSVKSVGEYAFSACRRLETIELPNAERIGTGAFANRNQLTTVTLGRTAPSLGDFILSDDWDTMEHNRYFGRRSTRPLNVKVPRGATGYNEDWKKRFLGNCESVTVTIVH